MSRLVQHQRSMSSMMVLQHNARTGQDEWVVVEAGSADADPGESSLVAASSYLDMLTDRKRNKAYHVALEHVLSKQDATPMSDNKTPKCLDIGTGTGLLAIMAGQVLRAQRQQAGCSTPPLGGGGAPVIACELFPTMAQVAKKVVAANGYQNEVAVIEKRSDDLLVQSEGPSSSQSSREDAARMARAGSTPKPDMGGKADVIVTEIFDSALLGEGLLPSMRHAKQHLLKEGGCVIPGRATVWAQVIQCPAMRQWSSPVANSATAGGPSHSSDSTAAPHAQQHAHTQPCSTQHSTAQHSGLPNSQTQRVLQLLSDLDAAAVESELQGVPYSSALGATCGHYGSGSEDGSGRGGSDLEDSEPSTLGSCGGEESSEGQPVCWQDLHELHVDVVQDQVTPLSAPLSVLGFDLADPPPEDQVKHGLQVPITHSGVADGVVLWWQLDMVPCKEQQPRESQQSPEKQQSPPELQQAASSSLPRSEPLLLSTAPCWVGTDPGCGGDGGPLQGVQQEWRGHWAQCWAKLGGHTGLQVAQGGQLALSVRHDDLGIQVALAPQCPSPPTQPGSAPSVPAAGDAPSGATAPAARDAPSAAAGNSVPAPPQPPLPPLRAWLPPPSMQQLNGPDGRWDTFEACLKATLQDCMRACHQGRRAPTSQTSAHETQGAPHTSPPAQSLSSSPLEVVCVGTGLISPDQLMPPLLVCACAREVAAAEGMDVKVTALADHGAAQRWLTVAGEALLTQGACVSDTTSSQASSHASSDTTGQRGHAVLSVQPESRYMEHAKKVHHSLSAQAPHGAHAPSAQVPHGVQHGSSHPPTGITLLVGDPSYHQGKGAAPCTHLLQFWSDVDVIRKAEAAKGRQVVCFPERAVLRAVAASLPHLDRTRQSLHMVEGVDLSAANSVLRGDGQIELSLGVPWQCGGEYTEVSPRSTLLHIDLATTPFSSPVQGCTQLHVNAPAKSTAAVPGVHGVVVWADYMLPSASHQGLAREHAGGAAAPPAAATVQVHASVTSGASSSGVIYNGPSAKAYSATQTVLLLPQHQRCSQLQGEQQLRVAVSLEDHGFSLGAELLRY